MLILGGLVHEGSGFTSAVSHSLADGALLELIRWRRGANFDHCTLITLTSTTAH